MARLMLVEAKDKEEVDRLANDRIPGLGPLCSVPLSASGQEPATHYWGGVVENSTALNNALSGVDSFRSWTWSRTKDLSFAQKKLKTLGLKRIME